MLGEHTPAAGHDNMRDPCPWVILNDFGGAFSMGCIGGAIWHGIKGARNSPRGERMLGSISAIKSRAPVLGGNFGIGVVCFKATTVLLYPFGKRRTRGTRFSQDSAPALLSLFVADQRLHLVQVLCVVSCWVSSRVSVQALIVPWRITTSRWRP